MKNQMLIKMFAQTFSKNTCFFFSAIIIFLNAPRICVPVAMGQNTICKGLHTNKHLNPSVFILSHLFMY